ncbi:MAG TPA: methylmalonyl-CoA mutase family protein, partial [Acidimicrobiia bacterium]|nr:methylmalonyl-CoA mutase family protein [Acidimicrobiia bacterium]
EGWMQAEIEESAYREARRQSSGESVVVGVNRFVVEGGEPIPVLEVDPMLEAAQIEALARHRERRDHDAVAAALADVESVARGDDNLMPSLRVALSAGATIGEVSDALRAVFGVHRPTG